MATKKQKRAAALAKREVFEAEVRRTGLLAQQKDRARREALKLKAAQEEAKRLKDEANKRNIEAINAMVGS